MKYSVDKKEDYAVLTLGEENLNSLKAPDLKAELIVLHNAGIKNFKVTFNFEYIVKGKLILNAFLKEVIN